MESKNKHLSQTKAGCSLCLSTVFLLVLASLWAGNSIASPTVPRWAEPTLDLPGFLLVDAGDDELICLGDTVQLQATGAASFQWAPTTGLSCSNCPNPLAFPDTTTLYIVTGSDGTLDSVLVTVSNPPQILGVSFTQPSNCNLPNGTILINTVDPGPYEYSVTGGLVWQNSGVFTALAPGSYSILVRTPGGACQVAGGTMNLVAPNSPQILNILENDPTFCDQPNGSIVVSASGGVVPLQYSIDGGLNWQNLNTFQLLGSGNYAIAVRNVDGSCEVSGGNVTLTGSPDEAFITDVFLAHPSNCGASDGIITVLVSNNDGNFEYSINGGIDYQPLNSFGNLEEGVYHVVVRRTNGTCVTSGGYVELVSSSRPQIFGTSSVGPQGCGTNDGNITILAFGPSTLEFSINGGTTWQPSNIFTGLSAGDYQIAVRNIDGSCLTNGGDLSLEAPVAPQITGVSFNNPSACGVSDGRINVAATGTAQLEYSVNNGQTWAQAGLFLNLAEGAYNVVVRYVGGSCQIAYALNPVILDASGTPPVINQVVAVPPTACGTADGSITIQAMGSGTLNYSINGGNTFQASNTFSNLASGSYSLVVSQVGGNCTATSVATLPTLGCTDTVLVTIPANITTEYCLDPSVFEISGQLSGAGFCNQGNAATVMASGINLDCIMLVPAAGFTGLSPDLICTIHCFNNNNSLCDTTYIKVTVQGQTNCDEIFGFDSVSVDFTGNPTNYCAHVPFSVILNDDISLNGSPLNAPVPCDFVSTTAYSYAFLPGAGFNGPYVLDAWTVNGVVVSGSFADANELVDLMNLLDPSGNWSINAQGGLILGGNPASTYADMDVTHTPSGTSTVLMTNFTQLPAGFTVSLTAPGAYVLVVTDPDNGCSDTLYINAVFNPVAPETVTLTTTVNTPTSIFCLDGSELPGGDIVSVGYCDNPNFGVAPLVNDTCIYYQPNLNFAGQDAFCMIVCDAGFPQICDTTFFVVNVVPERDTVLLTIPADETTIDTCLSNFVIELPGVITSASFCAINTAQVSGSVLGNCLTFSENSNFSGTTEVCVVQCSGGFCDTTIVLVTIEPPIVCDDIFGQSPIIIPSVNSGNVLCIPVTPGDIVSYDVTVDGVPYTSSFTPCDFQNRAVYNTSNVPAGAFNLLSWTVNGGTAHSGAFANLSALVDSMRVWNPAGDWAFNSISQTIEGWQSGNSFSPISLTPSGGLPLSLTVDFMLAPFGAQMPIAGFGSHQVVLTADNGCSDSATVVLQQHIVTTEVVLLSTSPNTTLGPVCANASELLGDLFSVSFCSLPSNGSVSMSNDTCLVYTPNLDFIGTDTICLVLCDDEPVFVCDTFIYVITVNPATDTLYITAPSTLPFDTCLTTAVVQLPGNIVSGSVCGFDPADVSLTVNGVCVTIDLAPGFTGTTLACVINCNDAVPAVCDTTILVISFDSTAAPCPEIFNPDQQFISLNNGSGQVCLPVPVNQIGNYQILLDGSFYNNSLMPCDFDSAYIYFYGLVFGQGGQGPYNISWQANGSTFTGTVANMVELAAFMNNLDPAGDWIVEPTIFTILSSNDQGVYGALTITHVASGMVSNLAPDFNGLPLGTGIIITGAGQHEVVLVSNADGCSDTLTVNAFNGVEVLEIQTLENVPSDIVCLDTMDLPGNFSQVSICLLPVNGDLIINGNCFTYNPDNGYVGPDQACVVVCDDLGNCDTTLLNISVSPVCSLFDFFPSGLQTTQVTDCSDISGYCVSVLLDSIGNFGVLDNGATYTGGFVPCNGDFTQIALDTGFHQIVFFHLNTGCSDTLLTQVNCVFDSTDCGTLALSPLSLMADDCAGTAQFCVDVPLTDLPNFLISDNGAALAGTVGPCDINAATIGVALDTGLHQLVFEDTVKGCLDTFIVQVSCFVLEDSVISATIPMGDTLVFCLADYGYPVPGVDSVEVVCLGNGNTSFVVDELTWCISIIGDSIGLDTACFQVFVGGDSALFSANIIVDDPCPVYFPTGYLAAGVPCSADSGLVCLPISLVEMQHKTLEINGVPYAQPLVPCNFDSTYVLNFSQVPNMGMLGDYIVEEWTVNGTVFTGVFNSAQALADSMNLWDPTGAWQVVVDPLSMATLIVGGDANNTYGVIRIVEEITGIEVMLGINATFVPMGVAVQIPIGSYQLTMTDTVTHCTETVTLELACVTSDVVIDTLLVGASDTFCLDFTELLGAVESVTNICPGSQGEIVSFTIANNCVIYQGNELGIDSACIVVCDDAGLCDTTYFYIVVEFAGDSIPIAVNDTIITGQGFATTIEVLINDTVLALLDFNILVPPGHGDAVFLPNGTLNYVPDPSYCDQDVPDSLTYEICNPFGCDTATVFITVICSELEIFDAFSPNGDTDNEFFKINGLQDYPDNKLTVFNRWGNLVYESKDYQNDWDGTWNGHKLPDGTYFYILDLGEGGDPLKGTVVILR